MLRILDQLDQRQTRLGVLNVVARVGTRDLDTRAAFMRRFDEVFLRKERLDEAAFATFEAELGARDRKAAKKLSDRRGTWVYAAERWIADARVLSPILSVDESRTGVFMDLARWMRLIGGAYGLTELGTVLKALQEPEPPADYNPLLINLRLREQALLTRTVLLADALTPFYLRSLVANASAEAGSNVGTELDCLRRSVEELLSRAREGADAAHALAVRGIVEYRERLASDNAAWHNARPRIEFMIDLELLEPAKDRRGLHPPTAAGRRAVIEWAPLIEDPKQTPQWADQSFFGSFARIHGREPVRYGGELERLMAIAKAFRKPVARPIGHTPASSVALLACLDLLEMGVLAEVDELLDSLREAAHGQFESMLSFSGGSRLDGEFLIRIDPALYRAAGGRVDV